jgi:hypothetical protein
MEEYGFRIRFRLPDSVRLGTEEVTTWALASGVWMSSLKQDEPIKEASALAVRGEGAGSAEEATHLGERWRDALETAFARLGVGADFGERGPRSFLSEAGMRWMEHQFGVPRVLNDEPGLSVFTLHPPPFFVAGSGAGMRSVDEAKTKAAITVAFASGPHHTPAQRLAFDLYSASFFQPAADARLLMLMMAIETMLDIQDRDKAAREPMSSSSCALLGRQICLTPRSSPCSVLLNGCCRNRSVSRGAGSLLALPDAPTWISSLGSSLQLATPCGATWCTA